MVEISTSILSVKKGEESKTFFALEKAKTDYFHIDVMDGKFVEKDTYQKMLEYASYIKRISNLPLDIHLMVEDINTAIDDFASVEPNIITFHYEVCKNKEEVMEVIKKIKKEIKMIYRESKIPKIYGLDEVSRMIGIPKGTLYNMKWRGVLPCLKIGKRIKMTEEHILQLIHKEGNLYGN